MQLVALAIKSISVVGDRDVFMSTFSIGWLGFGAALQPKLEHEILIKVNRIYRYIEEEILYFSGKAAAS